MKISIVIRSRNDREILGRTIDSLRAQRIDAELEFLHIDNQSGDGTWELIENLPPEVRKFRWPEGEYMPGKVLNFAVTQCTGEIVVFHNSDCIALDEHYLAELLRPLADAPENVDRITFANQIPRPDAKPLVRKDSLRAFGDGSDSKNWRHFFSLAASAAKREFLLREKFDETYLYSEDIEWSYRARKKGAEIVYVPGARVEHSHNYTLRECVKRFYNEGVANRRIFGEKPGFFRDFLLQLGRELLRDAIYIFRNREFRGLGRELAFRLVQRWNLYRGAQTEEFRK